jgi:hypothetical protein
MHLPVNLEDTCPVNPHFFAAFERIEMRGHVLRELQNMVRKRFATVYDLRDIQPLRVLVLSPDGNEVDIYRKAVNVTQKDNKQEKGNDGNVKSKRLPGDLFIKFVPYRPLDQVTPEDVARGRTSFPLPPADFRADVVVGLYCLSYTDERDLRRLPGVDNRTVFLYTAKHTFPGSGDGVDIYVARREVPSRMDYVENENPDDDGVTRGTWQPSDMMTKITGQFAIRRGNELYCHPSCNERPWVEPLAQHLQDGGYLGGEDYFQPHPHRRAFSNFTTFYRAVFVAEDMINDDYLAVTRFQYPVLPPDMVVKNNVLVQTNSDLLVSSTRFKPENRYGLEACTRAVTRAVGSALPKHLLHTVYHDLLQDIVEATLNHLLEMNARRAELTLNCGREVEVERAAASYRLGDSVAGKAVATALGHMAQPTRNKVDGAVNLLKGLVGAAKVVAGRLDQAILDRKVRAIDEACYKADLARAIELSQPDLDVSEITTDFELNVITSMTRIVGRLLKLSRRGRNAVNWFLRRVPLGPLEQLYTWMQDHQAVVNILEVLGSALFEGASAYMEESIKRMCPPLSVVIALIEVVPRTIDAVETVWLSRHGIVAPSKAASAIASLVLEFSTRALTHYALTWIPKPAAVLLHAAFNMVVKEGPSIFRKVQDLLRLRKPLVGEPGSIIDYGWAPPFGSNVDLAICAMDSKPLEINEAIGPLGKNPVSVIYGGSELNATEKPVYDMLVNYKARLARELPDSYVPNKVVALKNDVNGSFNMPIKNSVENLAATIVRLGAATPEQDSKLLASVCTSLRQSYEESDGRFCVADEVDDADFDHTVQAICDSEHTVAWKSMKLRALMYGWFHNLEDTSGFRMKYDELLLTKVIEGLATGEYSAVRVKARILTTLPDRDVLTIGIASRIKAYVDCRILYSTIEAIEATVAFVYFARPTAEGLARVQTYLFEVVGVLVIFQCHGDDVELITMWESCDNDLGTCDLTCKSAYQQSYFGIFDDMWQLTMCREYVSGLPRRLRHNCVHKENDPLDDPELDRIEYTNKTGHTNTGTGVTAIAASGASAVAWRALMDYLTTPIAQLDFNVRYAELEHLSDDERRAAAVLRVMSEALPTVGHRLGFVYESAPVVPRDAGVFLGRVPVETAGLALALSTTLNRYDLGGAPRWIDCPWTYVQMSPKCGLMPTDVFAGTYEEQQAQWAYVMGRALRCPLGAYYRAWYERWSHTHSLSYPRDDVWARYLEHLGTYKRDLVEFDYEVPLEPYFNSVRARVRRAADPELVELLLNEADELETELELLIASPGAELEIKSSMRCIFYARYGRLPAGTVTLGFP